MTVSEKVAYLKGLMEGLSFPADSPEGKILYCMADILDDLALTAEDLEKDAAQIRDYVEELDEDLGDVEEYLFTEEDENADEEDVDDLDDYDDEDEDDSGEDIYELECPSCGETIYLDESLLDETDILCPACHEPISFEIEAEDEEIEDVDTADYVGDGDSECEKPAFNYDSSD